MAEGVRNSIKVVRKVTVESRADVSVNGLELDEHERQPLVVVDVRAEISSVGPRVEYVALHSRTVSGSFRSSGTALDARALSLTLNTSKSPTSTGLSNEMSSTSKNRGLSPPNK